MERKNKGVKEEEWDTYITAKQKGQIDLLLSQLGPACYKLSTESTNMCAHTHTHTRTQTEGAINQPNSDTFGRCSVGKTKLKRTVNTESRSTAQPKLKVHNSAKYRFTSLLLMPMKKMTSSLFSCRHPSFPKVLF